MAVEHADVSSPKSASLSRTNTLSLALACPNSAHKPITSSEGFPALDTILSSESFKGMLTERNHQQSYISGLLL